MSRGASKKTKRAMNKRLGWFIRPMVALARDTRGLIREPEGTLAKHGRAINTAFERRRTAVSDHALLADLHFAFVPEDDRRQVLASFEQETVRRRRDLQSDPLGAELLALIDQADKKVTSGPIVLAAHLFERNDLALAAHASLLDAKRARSEERAARCFLAYAGKMLESQYQRYVRTVDTLDAWCRGEKPASDTFGQLVDRLARRHPVLVQKYAAKVRNALEHGEYTLSLAQQYVDLKNTYRGRTTWSQRMSFDALCTMVFEAGKACDLLCLALGLLAQERHVQARVFEHVFALGDAYAANDLDRVHRVSREYQDAMQRALTRGD